MHNSNTLILLGALSTTSMVQVIKAAVFPNLSCIPACMMNVPAAFLFLCLVKFNVIGATTPLKDTTSFQSPNVIADETLISGIVATTMHSEIPTDITTGTASSDLKTQENDVLTAILEPSPKRTRLNADESGLETIPLALPKAALQANFKVFNVKGDGACLFRAVAHQVYHTQEKHATVRQECMAYVESHPDDYKHSVVEDSFVAQELPPETTMAMIQEMETEARFETYVQVKKAPCTFGDHIELAAMSHLYQRPIQVYVRSRRGVFKRMTQGMPDNRYQDKDPIRLLYSRNGCAATAHYDAIDVSPRKRQVGTRLAVGFLVSFLVTVLEYAYSVNPFL